MRQDWPKFKDIHLTSDKKRRCKVFFLFFFTYVHTHMHHVWVQAHGQKLAYLPFQMNLD